MDASDSDSSKRGFEREVRRTTCELHTQGKSYQGVILDVSARGMFVQTTARLEEGAQLRVELCDLSNRPLVLFARVARIRATHRSLAALETGGLGLRIESAPEAYFQLVLSLTEKRQRR